MAKSSLRYAIAAFFAVNALTGIGIENSFAAIGGTHEVASSAIGGTHEVASSAIGGTHEVASSAIGGTHEVASSAIGGTHEVASRAIGGTHEVAVSAIGGTHEVASSAIGGTHEVASSAIGGTHEILVSGLATSIEQTELGITFHGQLFTASELVTSEARRIIDSKNYNVIEAVVNISELNGDISITSIRDTGEMYIPGASLIRAIVKVDNVLSSLAKLQIGGQLMDYSGLLGKRPQLSFSKDQLVTVIGVQPSIRGEILIAEVENF